MIVELNLTVRELHLDEAVLVEKMQPLVRTELRLVSGITLSYALQQLCGIFMSGMRDKGLSLALIICSFYKSSTLDFLSGALGRSKNIYIGLSA